MDRVSLLACLESFFDSKGLVYTYMFFQLLPCLINIHRVMWSNPAHMILIRPAPLQPILKVMVVFPGNDVDLRQIVADLWIVPDELGRQSQEVPGSIWNYCALAELEVYVGVFGSRLSDNTDESFTCNGVDGVFVLLQYFFEEVVVEALAARIEGGVEVKPLIDSHCVCLVE